MFDREPTKEERQAGYERAERRELHRIHSLSNQARDFIALLDAELLKCHDAATVSDAIVHLRGTGHTFARAVLALIELA